MAELVLLVVLLAVTVRPLGRYMARVYMGYPTLLTPVCAPVEKLTLRFIGIDASEEMHWRRYAYQLLWFAIICFAVLYSLLLLQGILPLNPRGLPGLPADLAFNITISFLTNTNWQSYAGEGTLSIFSQTLGLMVQHFIAPAVDMAVAVTLFRAFTRKNAETIGNFWQDFIRGVIYILLPLALAFSALYAAEGAVQSWSGSTPVETLSHKSETLITGPVAAQVAIKQLGSNGGGYYAANAAHPFENPTPLSNMLGLFAIMLLPVSLVYTFGIIAGDRRQGVMILVAMTLLIAPLIGIAMYQEAHWASTLPSDGVLTDAGNMEGKEQRFSVASSALWAVLTTSTSSGSTNSSHASMMPLTILAMLIPMKLGGIVFGGVGAGMLCMLMMVIVTVFMAGLMVGRTPEFLGKKLGPFEIKIAMLIFIIPGISVLLGTALSVSLDIGQAAMTPVGTQGYVEALYAFTSAANNNGSALGGLHANNIYYNSMLAISMFVGNFFIQIAGLAIAGSIAAKNITPVTPTTLLTHTPLFICMLMIVLFISVLAYAPAMALGPVVDYFHVRLIPHV